MSFKRSNQHGPAAPLHPLRACAGGIAKRGGHQGQPGGYLHPHGKTWKTAPPQNHPATDRWTTSAPSSTPGLCACGEKLLGAESQARHTYVIPGQLQRLARHLAGSAQRQRPRRRSCCSTDSPNATDHGIFEEYAAPRRCTHGIAACQRSEPPRPRHDPRASNPFPNASIHRGTLTNNRNWPTAPSRSACWARKNRSPWRDRSLPARRRRLLDMRKLLPYSAYDDFDFDIPLAERRRLRPLLCAWPKSTRVSASLSRPWTACRGDIRPNCPRC